MVPALMSLSSTARPSDLGLTLATLAVYIRTVRTYKIPAINITMRSEGSVGCRRVKPPQGHRLNSSAPLPPPIKVALPRRRYAPPQAYRGRLSFALRQPIDPQRETHPNISF